MLRQIALRGFKSFAQATSLELGPGLNVIVGPNGSGKSNLAEAIVWAMGEQRAAKLRASGMSEVVFSGGAHRPPAGLAEVRLTLVDEEPADIGRPSEVEVVRRITRTGDAGYRLNGANCRLLDVHEALALRGLGPDALAVIRQGQVEAVCTSRPSDIRAMLEEAAGVALSRRRRRRAELRLGRVAERLDRARDLQAELATRHASLERQAQAATRAAEIDAALSEARLRAQRAQAHAAARALAAARHARREADAHRAGADQRAREAGAAAARADQALEHLTTAQAEADRRRQTVRAAAQRVADRRDFAAERLAAARDAASARQAEADAARAAREELVQQRAAAARDVATHEAALDEATALLDTARAGLDAASGRAAAAARGADELAGRLRTHRRMADDAAARTVRATQALERARAERAALGDAPGGSDATRLERRAAVAAERVERWQGRHHAAQAHAADAAAARDAADARRRDTARELARLARPGKGRRGLGTDVRVEPGMEAAVGAALGELADAPWAGDVAAALEAVHGGAPCAVAPAPPRPAAYAGAPGRPLVDVIVECPADARPFVEQVLAGCFVVDDVTAVPAGRDGVFVTPAGDVVRPATGVVSRGGADWAREARRGALADALAGCQTDLSAAAAAHDDAAAAARRVAARVRAAERCRTRADRAREAALGAAAGHARALAEADARVANAAREHEAAVAAAPAPGDVPTDADVEAARRAAASDAEALVAARGAAATAEEAASACRAALSAARITVAERDARDAELARAAAPAEPVDLEPAQRAVAALTRAARALAARTDAFPEAARDEAAGVAQAQAARGAARAEAGRARESLREAEEAAHAAALAVAGAEARAESAGAPEGEDPGDVDLEAQARDVEALERRRRAVGTVNPLAADECAELAERIDDTGQQIADLESASAAIASHLGSLDDAVSAGFDGVFTAVRARFEEMIAALFPGGQGRLAVIGDDDDPGVEIQVVPQGKRPRPLALLSGGERTLVALAFCLAIATARPAPFYLLDEVEAALDDTNLRRLLAVVRRLSEHTQFVMITHQQPTVEIADTLFGVTMAADGVSEIVARRLDRGAESARPFVRRQLTAIRGGRA